MVVGNATNIDTSIIGAKNVLISTSKTCVGSPIDKRANDEFHLSTKHGESVCGGVNLKLNSTFGIEEETDVLLNTNGIIFIKGILVIVTMNDRKSGTKLNRRYRLVQ